MDKDKLKRVLEIPSYVGHETMVREYLTNWASERNILVFNDAKGNLYLKKGDLQEDKYYPCVVAHMDTVHTVQKQSVKNGKFLTIHEDVDDDSNNILYASLELEDGRIIHTGCGGDDKAGIYIALELIERHDTIIGAFFVEEEVGCLGSKEADLEILANVGYFIQFDAPTDNWVSKKCGGEILFNDEFESKLSSMWEKYDLTNISMKDPFTDVCALKKLFPVCCVNYFAGYMLMHTSYEYVVLDYVEKAIKVGEETIQLLGNEKYLF